MQRNFIFNRHRVRLSGYTLLEMVVASASAAILIGGLSSSLYIATQSLDVSSGSLAEARTAHEILARINSDLQSAVSLSELTATAVTMNVPDRNGDNVPEVIRYSWSGVTSDPLQVTYNGATSDLAADVQAFSFTWISRLIRGQTAFPIVLFVSSQAPDSGGDGGIATPSTTEQDRIDLMRGWGYDVTVISQQATQEQIDAEIANSTVIYVSGETSSTTIGTKLNAATIGVVTESYNNAQQLGFYTILLPFSQNSSQIAITNNTHYITENFSLGSLVVTSSEQALTWTLAPTAPDAIVLGSVDALFADSALVILDTGDELASGSTAAGRRCQLPWGEGSFDITALNTDGLTIMQRSLEWAAGAGTDTETPVNGVVYQEFTEQQESSNTSSVTVSTPAGTAEGDLLIAAVVTDDDEASSLTPSESGWNEIYVLADDDDDVTLGVWWRLASASEPSDYSFSWGSNEETYGWIMRFTGHNPDNPIHDTATTEGRSSSPDANAVTTAIDDCMILRIGGFDDDDINVGDAGMSGHTTITCDESGSGSGTCSGAAAYVIQGGAGSAGTAEFNIDGSEQYRTVTIAIEPAP